MKIFVFSHTDGGNAAFKVLLWVAAFLAVGSLIYGTYIWQHRKIDDLNQQITQLNADLSAAKKIQTPMTNNDYTSKKGVRIKVYTPASNSELASPVMVVGEVPGNWSFEASFPVKLLDDKGGVIAQGAAQLQGNWMTDILVPFSVKLTYTSATRGNGTLVLQKDNPSGLEANDDSVSISVKL